MIRLTSFVEFETKSDEVLSSSSLSSSSSSSSSSEKEPSETYVQEASGTKKLIEEINQLQRKIECLQKKTIRCLKKINY